MQFTALLSDWQKYQRSPEGAFPDWCRARNRSYNWPNTVYQSE